MKTVKYSLGRLERADLRQIWRTEAEEFTPWLATEENLRLLGDTLGLELELEGQEKSVGPFRADLLCKETATNTWVVVENQLERTDHIHLGQLLTYAAGLKATSTIWIAATFSEEHRAALDWLNEITDSRFNFFGLEVELWRIGDFPVAPKFNIVCKPNDWSKTVGQVDRVALTEAKRSQLDFWIAFRSFVSERGSHLKPQKPLPQHWMNLAVGRTGFRLAAIASFWDSTAKSYESHELRAELIIEHQNSKADFADLESMKDEIEVELGEPLTWYNPPERRVCKIYLRHSADLNDRDSWPEQHDWLLEKLESLHRAFAKRVQQLGRADPIKQHAASATDRP